MHGDFSRNTFDPRRHYRTVLMQQGRVQVDADWNEQQQIHSRRAEIETLDVVGPSGAPSASPAFGLSFTPGSSDLVISSGRFYVDGILCELEKETTYLSQTDYPGGDTALVTAASGSAPAKLNLANGTYLAYLDVWQRHVTALDDPLMRERALGGPDTATRSKTVAQVKLLQVTPPQGTLGLNTDFPEWDALVQAGSAALSARSQPAGPGGPCLIPPNGGFQGLENQLYRVEIHDPGPFGTATFKWSRDNGSVVTAIQSFSGSTLTVQSLGPDDVLGFSNSQWVEVIGDVNELHGLPGQLIQIDHVDPSNSKVFLKSSPNPIDPQFNPKLRRWDSAGPLAVAAAATNNGWIVLENGVQVIFANTGSYHTGDYWLIPARAGATADIEWPYALPQPPLGIRHHYCRLGLIHWPITNAAQPVQDWRLSFLPLTEVPPALHVQSVSWLNDDQYTMAQLTQNGLQVSLDGPPTSAISVTVDPTQPPVALTLTTVNESSMIVTLEVPATLSGQTSPAVNPRTLAVLRGNVVVNGTVVQWLPVSQGLEIQELLANLSGSQPRVRVTLKGSSIWSDQSGQRLYLDGATFGQPGLKSTDPQNPVPRTDLVFPSGSRGRASDFESWFFLQYIPPQPVLTGVTVSPALAVGAITIAGSVNLSSVAPAGGATVGLASSNANIANVSAATVVVPANSSSAPFSVTVAATAPVGTYFLNITATHGNDPPIQANLAVVIVAVSVSPPAVTLFPSGTTQFAASVAGINAQLSGPGGVSTAVTWSVPANGGSISQTGSYTAPAVAGTYTVTAISVADPSKSGTATVVVRGKSKDKDKEAQFDKVADKHAIVDKVVENKLRDAVGGPVIRPAIATPLRQQATASADPVLLEEQPVANASTPAAPRRAFILSEERPPVGVGVVSRHG